MEISPKKTYKQQINIWKNVNRKSLENCKLIQQCYNTIHLLEWLKPIALITSDAGKGVEAQELSFIAGRIAKWYSYFGRQFDRFLKYYTYFYHKIPQSHSLIAIHGMFTADLFIVVKNQKQPRSPSTSEWRNKL